MLRRLLLVLLLAATAKMHAQLPTSSPVLAAPPNIIYPPIARAAHISGNVVATFTIEADGTTSTVQPVSGPEMLRYAVLNGIKQWRFKTPLPIGAETHFTATYHFRLEQDSYDAEDNLDGPPYSPCCGDMIAVAAANGKVTGEVASLIGNQTIDVSATPTPSPDNRCPEDKQKSPPPTTDLSDFVELRRSSCPIDCPDYRVRVTRSGRVTWFGRDGVSAMGNRDALLNQSDAEALLEKFQTPAFWSACFVEVPQQPNPKVTPKPRKPDEDESDAEQAEEASMGVYMTAHIGGLTKSVTTGQNSFTDTAIAERFVWAIDKAADTHRWRHGDPATEPFTNMHEDLLFHPKPGITALMRATLHFNPHTADRTYTAIEQLLKRGADIEATDASGWTALMYAAYFDWNTEPPVKLLLEARADPNHASLHGDTPLMFAAYNGFLNQQLLGHGANINASNADGVTTLMFLAQRYDPEKIQDALKAGADPHAQDRAGRTALDYLRAASCGKVIIPLPKLDMQIIPPNPQPCPDTANSNFTASEALLIKAMRRTNP